MPTRRLNPTPRRLVEEKGKLAVTADLKHRGQIQQQNRTEEVLGVRRFKDGEHPAYVRVSAGMTINMGDFNSLRIDVSVTLPCLPEEIESTYEEASERTAQFVSIEQERWGASTKVR